MLRMILLKFRWGTHRLLLDVVEGIGGGVNDLALNLVGPTSVVSDAADGSTDITLGHGEGLAVVERLDRRKLIGVALHQLGKLVEVLSALLGCDFPPLALEHLPCC